MDHNLPGSSVHEILQARILESVATPSSRASWQPRDLTPALAGKFFTTITTWEAPFLHTLYQKKFQDLKAKFQDLKGGGGGVGEKGGKEKEKKNWDLEEN